MGVISALIRLVWLVTIGWWLGGIYFGLMLLMSPFGTLASGKILDNTRKIMFLTAG
jgi:hypothetical protein